MAGMTRILRAVWAEQGSTIYRQARQDLILQRRKNRLTLVFGGSSGSSGSSGSVRIDPIAGLRKISLGMGGAAVEVGRMAGHWRDGLASSG